MKIYYEIGDWIVCIDKKNNSFVKYNINKPLSNFVLKDFKLEEKSIFLLDENRFNFFSFDIFLETEKPFTIGEFKAIAKEKQTFIDTNYPKNGVLLTYFVDDIFENSQSVKHFLGLKGKIYFRLKFIYLDYRSQNLFKIFTGNKFYENKDIIIYPQSFFTLNFIKKYLNKDNFNILYIYPEYAKFLTVKKGFYQDIARIEMGTDKLKQIFKDNDIYNMYNDTFDKKNFNEFALNLINSSFDFYCDMFCKWIKAQTLSSKDLILVSKLSKNSFFVDSFSPKYSKYIGGYVLPFHSSKHIQTKNFENFKILDLTIFANEYLKIN